jgi:hypothetical protein
VNVNDGQWHHVVGVYDGTRSCLYIDGSLDTSAQATGRISDDDEPVLIGDNSQYGNRFWDGLIDDVRVYGRALPESQVKALCEGRATGAQTQASVLPHILPARQASDAKPEPSGP